MCAGACVCYIYVALSSKRSVCYAVCVCTPRYLLQNAYFEHQTWENIYVYVRTHCEGCTRKIRTRQARKTANGRYRRDSRSLEMKVGWAVWMWWSCVHVIHSLEGMWCDVMLNIRILENVRCSGDFCKIFWAVFNIITFIEYSNRYEDFLKNYSTLSRHDIPWI